MTSTRYGELQQRVDELDRTIDLLESRRESLASQQREIIATDRNGVDDEDGDGAERDPEARRVCSTATKAKVSELADEFEYGAPTELVVDELAVERGYNPDAIEHEIEQLKRRGEVYEPRTDCLRST